MKNKTRMFLIVTLLMFFTLLLFACNSSIQNEYGRCQETATNLMPSNKVPPDGQLQRSGFSGNTTEGINFLTVETELTASQLLEYYNKQTIEQRTDWVLDNSEMYSRVAWSNWFVTDKCGEQWDGLITIVQSDPTLEPFITIRIKKH